MAILVAIGLPSSEGQCCCYVTVGESPEIVIEPAPLTHVRSGEMFVLSCQAVGRPIPRIYWTLNGQRLPRDHNMPRRIAAFQSGVTAKLSLSR